LAPGARGLLRVAATDSMGAPVRNTAIGSAAMQAASLSMRPRSGFPSRPSLRDSHVVFMPGTPFVQVQPTHMLAYQAVRLARLP